MENHLEFSLGSYLIALVFFALSLGLAFYSYKNTRITTKKKILFIAIRFVSLFLLCVMLLDPVLSFINIKKIPPAYSILIDNSESMQIREKGIKRLDKIKDILHAHQNSFSEIGIPHFYSFGKTTKPNISIDSLSFQEKETDIASAIDYINSISSEKKIKTIILFSDGQYTIGNNPIQSAINSKIPIYTVIIGDTSSRQDVILQRVFAPTKALQGTTIPITTLIIQKGFTGRFVEVTISSGNKKIETKNIRLLSKETTVDFNLKVENEGEQKYEINVSSLENEFSIKNNYEMFYIDVLKKKKKILVIAGLPDPEISAVRNTLSTNSDIESVFYTQRTINTFFEGPINFDQVKEVDACILIGFPGETTASSLSQTVYAFLQKNSIPTFSLFTFQSTSSKLKEVEPLLAVSLSLAPSSNLYEGIAFPYATSIATPFSIFKTYTSSLDATLKKIQPLSYYDFNFQLKPQAVGLFNLFINNSQTNKVFFAISKTEKTKYATMLGLQLWRLSLSSDPDVKSLYNTILLGTIDWLTSKDDITKLLVTPSAKTFDIFSPMTFQAIAQDELYDPIANAEIQITIANKQTKNIFKTTFQQTEQKGLYKASFESLPAGEYSYYADGKYGAKIFPRSSGTFLVAETNHEVRNVEANHEVMQSIASHSGGEFFTENDFQRIFQSNFLHFNNEEKKSVRVFSFSQSTMMLIFLIGFLCLEWMLRKIHSLP